MPIFYQDNIAEDTKLGIWKIEEEEAYFASRIPLSREITHPHKRLQHFAGRNLLPELYPGFPLSEIRIAETRKPFLENDPYHFSISHCGDFAAAIVSSNRQVGVDIELVTPKIERVADKFLTPAEKSILARGHFSPFAFRQHLTRLWSAKEAIFKWYGAGQVDFRQHIQLVTDVVLADPSEVVGLPFIFSKEKKKLLTVHIKTFGELQLAWVVD